MAQAKLFTKPTTDVPAGLKWSSEAAEKAAEKNSFIRVGGEKISHRFLSGSSRSWSNDDAEENRTIFLVVFRLSGTPENVALALKHAGYTEEQIKSFLSDAITSDNFQTTKKSEFDEEIERHKTGKLNKPLVDNYDFEQLKWFAEHIKDAKIENKKSTPKGLGSQDVITVAKTRLSPGSSLKERVEKLQDGHLLDVSDMGADFKGVKTKPAPKTEKSGKHFSSDLPFMSNNLDKYIKAVENVYGADGVTKYAKNIDEVRQKLQGIKVQANNSSIPLPNQAPKSAITIPLPSKTQAVPVPTTAQGIPKIKSPKVSTIGGGGFPNLPLMK